MHKFFVSFGTDHNHEYFGCKFGYDHAAIIAAPNYDIARQIADVLFGREYCTIYNERPEGLHCSMVPVNPWNHYNK